MKPRGAHFSCALLVFAPPIDPVFAQPEEDERLRLQKVEIVGSHLKRVQQEGPTPVSIYRREEIEASGVSRLVDFLRRLPFQTGGFDDQATSFNFLTGAAALSLRGLGPGATLILLNGRRIAAYGVALDNDETFVDLNSLPLAAVDRVEVLRDGASAIYGADAIGGVVIIVLRRDFRGAETVLRVGRSTHGDGDRAYASATYGAGTLAIDGYNAFVTLDALRQRALPHTAREFSRSADQRPRGGSDWRSPRSFPPSLRFPGEDPMPAADCPPLQVSTRPGVPGQLCLFDTNPYQLLTPKVERAGALAVGSVEPKATLRLYGELALNRTRSERQIAPSPLDQLLPASAASNPFGRDVFVLARPVDVGPRRSVVTVDFVRAVAGVQGGWRDWDWDLAAGTSRIRTDYASTNQLRDSAVQTALDAGTLNPFIAANDAALLESLKVDVLDRYRGQSSFVQAKASSEVTRLAHGPLALAVGAERRRESFSTQLDPLHLASGVAGSANNGVQNVGATRTVAAAFVEFNWPAAAGVEVQLAARNDRYSDYGSSTSPKVALRWQPAKTVLLRASAGRGFLPPSLPQVNKPREQFDDEFADPIRCPATGSADDCLLVALHSREGNMQLKAERSRQHNIGIVLEPMPALSVSLDVWRVVHREKIVFGDRFILDNEGAFPGRVVRAPPSADDLARGLPGPIVELRDTYINLAQRDVRGADLELRWRLAPRSWGTLSFDALLSRIHRFVERITPAAPADDRAGSDGLPRTRANLGVSWQHGPWQAGVNARYVGGYRYAVEGSGVVRTVGSWTSFDLTTGWRSERDQVLLTLQNVGNRAPPMRDALDGYDLLVHEPLGRFVSLSWRHSF